MGNVILCLLLTFSISGRVLGQENSTGKPATVSEARAVFDLSEQLLVKTGGEFQSGVAYQSFNAEGNATDIAKRIHEELTKRGLKQLEGASFTDVYCSAFYQKSGFTFSLMIMPTGSPNTVMVTLMNQGNVDLRTLPKPADIKELYAQPASAMYLSDLPVDEAKQECRHLLERDGWQWFGDTTVSFFMRQNAVRLQVMCSSAPAQQGKTAIQFSTELMSSALPTIPDLVRVGYSDKTMRLDGDSKLTLDQFATDYRKALESAGWKPTTEQPVKIDFREHLIFRNKAEELADLSFSTVDSLTRFDLKFMTVAQVEKENRRAEAMAVEAKQKQDAERARMENPPSIAIDKPNSASLAKATKQSLEWTVPSGTAQAVVAKWLQTQKATGWKIESTVETREFGEFTLTNGEQTLRLSFVDPGFVPGEITIGTSKKFQLQVNQ